MLSTSTTTGPYNQCSCKQNLLLLIRLSPHVSASFTFDIILSSCKWISYSAKPQASSIAKSVSTA